MQRFRQEALQQPVTAAEPEWAVRNRIVALLDCVLRLHGRAAAEGLFTASRRTPVRRRFARLAVADP
ncbi:MAG: hypothetical protein ACKO3M_02065 [Rubrivivax sp.]